MKNKFLNSSLKMIRNNNSNLSEIELEEIRYGLEGIYLTITKTIVIFALSLILGVFKEMLLLLFFFNILRSTGFGLHAKKSWQCWISSIILFVFLPMLAKVIIIPFRIRFIIDMLSIILVFKFAPADTEKHPLINEKKRKIWKIITTINTIFIVLLNLIIKDNTIINLIIFSIYIEIILINPLTYKFLNLNYNNYQKYNLEVEVV